MRLTLSVRYMRLGHVKIAVEVYVVSPGAIDVLACGSDIFAQ